MSGTFPTTGFKTMEFKSNTNTRVTTTLSGKTKRSQIASQFFSFKLSSNALSLTDFKAINAFINKQKGRFDSFTIVPPEVSSTSAAFFGTIDVDTAGNSAGDTAINVDAHTGPATILKAGDLIKFSNHDKVYQVTEDFVSAADGTGQVNIFPSLRTAITSSHTVQFNDVPFKVFLNQDQSTFTTNQLGYYYYTIEVREEI